MGDFAKRVLPPMTIEIIEDGKTTIWEEADPREHSLRILASKHPDATFRLHPANNSGDIIEMDATSFG